MGALCLRLVRLRKCFFLSLHTASNNGPKEFIGSTAIAGCLIGSSEEIGNRAVLDDDSLEWKRSIVVGGGVGSLGGCEQSGGGGVIVAYLACYVIIKFE